MRTLDEVLAKEKESADRCKKIFEEFEKNRQSSYDCGYEVGYNKAIDDYKYLLAERLEAGRCVDEKFAYIDLCDIDEISEQLKSGGENA